MVQRVRPGVAGLMVLFSGLWCSPAFGQDTAKPSASGAVVLDTAGFWRLHHTMRPPVMQDDGNLATIPRYDPNAKGGWQEGQLRFWHYTLLAGETAPPAADWTKDDFDDSLWVRGTAYRACHTPYLYRLCLRGKFAVSDPAKVKDLTLELGYHGGAVVYVNGQEVARQDLQSGAALAKAYPADAFVDEDGKLILLRGEAPLWKKKPSAETAKRMAARVRTLTAAVPAKLLRQGTNTVAVEWSARRTTRPWTSRRWFPRITARTTPPNSRGTPAK